MAKPQVVGTISGHSGEMTFTEADLLGDALENLESKLQKRYEEAGMAYSLTTETLPGGGLKVSWRGI